jgi:hypothetical protein
VTRLLAVLAAALITLAACGGSPSPTASRSPAPTPAATTSSAAQVIAAARQLECEDFTAVSDRMTADTISAHRVIDLIGIVTADAKPWMHGLHAAVRDGDRNVPDGSNAATNMAVRIARVNLEISQLNVYAAILSPGNIGRIKPLWGKIVRQMAAISTACNG